MGQCVDAWRVRQRVDEQGVDSWTVGTVYGCPNGVDSMMDHRRYFPQYEIA